MKTLNNLNTIEGLEELKSSELILIDGGATPSKDTSFANDLAYYAAYGAHVIWDGLRAFSSGASEGAHLRYSG